MIRVRAKHRRDRPVARVLTGIANRVLADAIADEKRKMRRIRAFLRGGQWPKRFLRQRAKIARDRALAIIGGMAAYRRHCKMET